MTDTLATQIHRIGRRAQARGWDAAVNDYGQYDLTKGNLLVSITYGPSTGLVHDAVARVLDDNGDAVSRETIVRADDIDKTRKVINYLTRN
ncbi:hypothetical protein SEA_SHAGRAT_41 [Rhodococcus phage Shagrat]|nr:hypothetical protein SEA_SHAGRAT_41 [Rhodococcus phage Shagrat]